MNIIRFLLIFKWVEYSIYSFNIDNINANTHIIYLFCHPIYKYNFYVLIIPFYHW